MGEIAVHQGQPDHVGHLAERVERRQPRGVEANGVHEDEALPLAHDDHVPAEGDGRTLQAHGPGDEVHAWENFANGAVRERGRVWSGNEGHGTLLPSRGLRAKELRQNAGREHRLSEARGSSQT